MVTSSNKYNFSKRFLWGAASSAHQYEGAPDSQWAAWEDKNASSLSKAAQYRMDHVPVWKDVKEQASNRENYLSGQGNGHYERFAEDFDLLNSLNLNAWRFSIEWSRLEPEEGRWNQAEIDRYHRYFEELKRRKIEPVVTLFHFSLPKWFEDKGGFEKTANVDHFVNYAEKVFAEYGQYLRLVATINEPDIYIQRGWLAENGWPPAKHGNYIGAVKVYYNLARAHKRVYQAAKRRSRRIKIGLVSNLSHHYLADESIKSKAALAINRYRKDEWLLNRLRRQIDWIGVNYYFSDRYQLGKIDNLNQQVNDLGWEMLPAKIEQVLVRTYKKYGKPIIITENGVADMNDKYRRWWIAYTIGAIHKALKQGVRVEGYLHWSLLDNFEWSDGFWPRFGLFAVDYQTFERKPRESAIWFGKVIAKLRRG